MSNTDRQPESNPELTTPAPSEEDRGQASWLFILGAIALLGVAVFICAQVIGVLYGIINPPLPPIPDRATEISHESRAYGVDDWMYVSEQDPCAVVELYVLDGAICRTAPSTCTSSPQPTGGSMVSQCFGTRDFAIFSMRYEAVISRSGAHPGGTDLRLIRNVNWLGSSAPEASE